MGSLFLTHEVRGIAKKKVAVDSDSKMLDFKGFCGLVEASLLSVSDLFKVQ